MSKETPICKADNKGNKIWYDGLGLYHRKDGPALEFSDGTKAWYNHGEVHRIDGPAVIWENGEENWYLFGKVYSDQLTYWLAVSEWKKYNGTEI